MLTKSSHDLYKLAIVDRLILYLGHLPVYWIRGIVPGPDEISSHQGNVITYIHVLGVYPTAYGDSVGIGGGFFVAFTNTHVLLVTSNEK